MPAQLSAVMRLRRRAEETPMTSIRRTACRMTCVMGEVRWAEARGAFAEAALESGAPGAGRRRRVVGGGWWWWVGWGRAC